MSTTALCTPRSLGHALCSFIIAIATAVALAQQDNQPFSRTDLESLRPQATAGDPKAQTDLALRYIEGAGVGQDYKQAVEWLTKAAMQGDARGQMELGVMYVNGEGVQADLREAYAWYWLSSQQGNQQAREYLEDLNRSLSTSDRQWARTRAAELTKAMEMERQAKPKHGRHRQTATPADPTSPKPGPSERKSASANKSTPDRQAQAARTRTFTEGKDYTIWQRVRIKDQNGFSQPVEAYSILLPKGWRIEGQVNWVINTACAAEAVQNRVTATSPDGAFRLEVFPQRNWQWYDDPMLLQNAQAAAQFGNPGCPLARPYDAGEYLEQVFVPGDLRGAQLVSHQPNEQMVNIMRQEAQRANTLYQSSGVNLESRPSAQIGRVKWPDSRIGIVLCAVEQTVATMPNLLNGGNYASYQCRATVKTMLSAPAGREQEAEQILGTIVASVRINPEWQTAVQRVFNNIAQVELRETAKRAAIWRQTQSEISAIQRRTWEDSQASRDRISEGWSQALRGVETWKEPGGGTIELSGGYNEAWSKGDGTYILSNDPLFNPSVVFQEDWTRLEKGR
jgi:hypothetical protein